MVIIDYFFYRFYNYYLKHYDRNEAMFTSVCAIGASVGVLSMSLYGPVLYILGFDLRNSVLPITIFWYLITYLRYRNKKEFLAEKFKNSKWNKWISDKVLWLFILLSWVMGILIIIPIRHFVWGYFDQGDGLRWILSLFE